MKTPGLFRLFGKAAAQNSRDVSPPVEFSAREAIACRGILKRLIPVVERFPRDYDYVYRAMRDMLRAFEGGDDLAGFAKTWAALVNDVASTPQWRELLFPSESLPSANNEDAGSLDDRFSVFLDALATDDPASGPPFLFLSRFYFFRDILCAYFVDESLKPIQRDIFHQCYLQRHNWRQSYAADYPYQGMERLGISGIKPTEERLARYDIAEYLETSGRVLDIGSNNGFLALALAASVAHVDGLEFNPYLVAMANLAKQHLGVHNASFLLGDFVDFETSESYDAVCSLANHCTIDGNLSLAFERYIAKVFSLLKPGGMLFFESHNVFGPGAGGPGDDGDLEAKFDIAERYFAVLKHKMTHAYVPAFDIDKLFVVMRRRERYEPHAVRTLRLSDARQRYAY